MISGIDISNNNWATLSQVGFAPLYDTEQFIIMKASEGATYKDRFVDLYYNMVHGAEDGKPDANRLYGFYHYARPEKGNTPLQEVHNFLRCIGHHAGYAIFALDVEEDALHLPNDYLDAWVAEWCDYFIKYMSVKPMIYCSAWDCNRFPSAYDRDCGLWAAKWSSKKPTRKEINPWPFWAIWQHSNSNGTLDLDVFNGDIDAWRKYCAVIK